MPNSEDLKVTVVSAGIVGAAIAFHLSRLRVNVTVLEAETPGAGASGHSFAWINSFGKEPRHYHDLNRRSMDTWDRFARLLDAEVGLKWGGHLTWASNEEQAEGLREQVQRVQSWGYNARMVDEKFIKSLEPGLEPDAVTAAAFTANEGHVLPPRVAEICMDRVRLNGGRVHMNRKVTGIQTTSGGATIVETTGGPIECVVVALCAGVGNTALIFALPSSVATEQMNGVNVEPGSYGSVTQRCRPRRGLMSLYGSLGCCDHPSRGWIMSAIARISPVDGSATTIRPPLALHRRISFMR